MAIVMTDAEDIVRGEDRQFQFYFVNAGTTTQASLPTGAAGHAYSLTLTHTDGGTAIVTNGLVITLRFMVNDRFYIVTS